MNLTSLCKLADCERNKPRDEAILLLRQILAWFQALPEQFDEDELIQELPQAVENYDDVFDCSLAEKGFAKIGMYNTIISKKVKLSTKEVNMFNNFSKMVLAKIYSISQYLESDAKTEIFFYFKKEREFAHFCQNMHKIFPDFTIDYEYDNNISEDNDKLVCMYVSMADLAKD